MTAAEIAPTTDVLNLFSPLDYSNGMNLHPGTTATNPVPIAVVRFYRLVIVKVVYLPRCIDALVCHLRNLCGLLCRIGSQLVIDSPHHSHAPSSI